jgi:alpha-glucosidase (family GH31 glycosyl hydrolase)
MFKASIYGGMVVRPAYFDYPNEIAIPKKYEETIMIGDHVLLHPVYESNIIRKDFYFPTGGWIDFKTYL